MMFMSIWNRTKPCVTARGSASYMNAQKGTDKMSAKKAGKRSYKQQTQKPNMQTKHDDN